MTTKASFAEETTRPIHGSGSAQFKLWPNSPTWVRDTKEILKTKVYP